MSNFNRCTCEIIWIKHDELFNKTSGYILLSFDSYAERDILWLSKPESTTAHWLSTWVLIPSWHESVEYNTAYCRLCGKNYLNVFELNNIKNIYKYSSTRTEDICFYITEVLNIKPFKGDL